MAADDFPLVERSILSSKSVGRSALPLPSRKKDGFSRQDIVNQFQEAFQVIGGTSRLSLWANENPDRFYALYTKLFPATTLALGAGSVLEIKHALPPTPLDAHADWNPPQKQEESAD